MRWKEKLSEEQEAYLERLCATDAAVADAHQLTQEFARMVRNLEGEELDGWLREAEASKAPAAMEAFRRRAWEGPLDGVGRADGEVEQRACGGFRPQAQACEAPGLRPGGLRSAEGEGAGSLTAAYERVHAREDHALHQLPDRTRILRRGLRGEFRTQTLLCTDLAAGPERIISWSSPGSCGAGRLGTTFQEVCQRLGLETQRHWSKRATEDRSCPAGSVLYWSRCSLTSIWRRVYKQPDERPGSANPIGPSLMRWRW